jgi:hypothetical protein
MNYEEKIARLEADYRSPFPKEYRSLLEDSPAGFFLNKERHVGHRIEQMRFSTGRGK